MSRTTRNRKNTCAICMEQGADLFTDKCDPPGKHHFCERCITKWIGEGHNTCPCCKQSFTQLITKHGYVMRRGVKRAREDPADEDAGSITLLERRAILQVAHQLFQQYRSRSGGTIRFNLTIMRATRDGAAPSQ